MKRVFLETVENQPPLSQGAAIALGVFDGMHQGHLMVLGKVCEVAERLRLDRVVVTFSIHPERQVNGAPPKMILGLHHRLRLMERAGIDLAVVIPFDERVRNTPADRFLKDFLLGSLNTRALVIGHDTAFGRDREGDADFLNARRADHGYELIQAPEVKIRDRTISSTRIREAILSGDLVLVEEMLGRELSMMGRVVEGDRRGRQLGFPTANLDCENAILPPRGVYAVRVLIRGITRRAVMNIGERPTFYHGNRQVRTVVEVHIPNFEGDLYGQEMEVFVVKKIRDEKRFSGIEELKDAIRADIASLGR